MLYFILVIIVGLLIRRVDSFEKWQEVKQKLPLIREKTQFIEAVSSSERWKASDNIGDLLEK